MTGLIVLGFFALYVAVAIGATVRAKGWWKLLALAAFVLIPTWDTLVNRIYHKQVICKNREIGIQVFESIRLPSDLYDAGGVPLIFDRYGKFDEKKTENRYKESSKYVEEGAWLTGVTKYTFEIIDAQSGRALARFTNYFAAGGGWPFLPLRPLSKYFGEYAFRSDPQACLDLDTDWIGNTAMAPFVEKNKAN